MKPNYDNVASAFRRSHHWVTCALVGSITNMSGFRF